MLYYKTNFSRKCPIQVDLPLNLSINQSIMNKSSCTSYLRCIIIHNKSFGIILIYQRDMTTSHQ